MEQSKGFYLRRHADEVAAAAAAETKQVRVVHLELALRYSLLASRLEREEQG